MLRHNLDEVARDVIALREGFRAMARGEMQNDMLDAMATRGDELLHHGFDTQTAPDGSAWVPPARDYGHPLLHKTGAMEDSAECEPGPRDDGQGFSLTFSVRDEKAILHQVGTFRGGPTSSPLRAQSRKSRSQGERQHIPARKMIFDPGERPDHWIDELTKVGQTAAERWCSAKFKI